MFYLFNDTLNTFLLTVISVLDEQLRENIECLADGDHAACEHYHLSLSSNIQSQS